MNKILLYLLFTCSCYAGGQGGRITISGGTLDATRVNSGKISYIGYTQPISNDTTVVNGQTLVLQAGNIYVFTNLTINDGGTIQITNTTGTTPAWTQIICTNFTGTASTIANKIITDTFQWRSLTSLIAVLDGFDGFKTNMTYPALTLTSGNGGVGGSGTTFGTGTIYGGGGGGSGYDWANDAGSGFLNRGIFTGGKGGSGYSVSLANNISGGAGGIDFGAVGSTPATVNDTSGFAGDTTSGAGGGGGTPGLSSGLLYMRVLGTTTTSANVVIRASGGKGGAGGNGGSAVNTSVNAVFVGGGGGGGGGRGGNSGNIIFRYSGSVVGALPSLNVSAIGTGGTGGSGGAATAFGLGTAIAGSTGTAGGIGTAGTATTITP